MIEDDERTEEDDADVKERMNLADKMLKDVPRGAIYVDRKKSGLVVAFRMPRRN